MKEQDVLELLDKNRVVYFATITQNGQPRVRPITIIHINEGKIYFFTGSFKEIYKQLLDNPHVEFSIQGKGVSIRVRGTVKFEENLEFVNKLLGQKEVIKTIYKDRLDELKLFYIEHGEVHLYKMSNPLEKTNHFAFKIK